MPHKFIEILDLVLGEVANIVTTFQQIDNCNQILDIQAEIIKLKWIVWCSELSN